jgi:hypothetical protein
VIDLKAGRQTSLIPNLDKPQAAYYDADYQSPLRLLERRRLGEDVDGITFHPLQTIKYSADSDNLRCDAKNKRVIVGYGAEKFICGAPARQQGDGALGSTGPCGPTG